MAFEEKIRDMEIYTLTHFPSGRVVIFTELQTKLAFMHPLKNVFENEQTFGHLKTTKYICERQCLNTTNHDKFIPLCLCLGFKISYHIY